MTPSYIMFYGPHVKETVLGWICEAQELHFQSLKIFPCKSRSLQKVNTKKACIERFLNFLKFFFENIHVNIIPHSVLAGKNQIQKFAYIKAS